MASLAQKPIQVYLDTEQLDALETLATQRQTSVEELIRSGIDRLLADSSVEDDPLWEIIGIVESDQHDLAEKHDQHLAEIIRQENS